MKAPPWAFPPYPEEEDRALLQRVAAAWEAAAARWPGRISCGVGCTPCCKGIFEISALDASRLWEGMARLQRQAPADWQGVVERARQQWEILQPFFPGDPQVRILTAQEEARRRFMARFAHLPCPALEPTSGRCLLYAFRPLSCRTFGLPVRVGRQLLAPCPLNHGVPKTHWKEYALLADPEDEEGQIMARHQLQGESVVAAICAWAGQS